MRFAKLLELNFFLTITDIAMASPTAKVKVVLEVGAKLRGQASLKHLYQYKNLKVVQS